MRHHVLARLGSVPPTLLGVAVVVFVLIRLIPGDPAEVMLGGFATPERTAEMRRHLGLDRPIVVQFAWWLGGLVQGNLGSSIMTRRPVAEEIWTRFPATLELTLCATVFAVVVGVTLGVVSAAVHNSRLDLGLTIVSVLGMSTPIFWFGLMLLYVFGVWLALLPISGRLEVGTTLPRLTGLVLVDSAVQGRFGVWADGLRHLLLPAFSLAVIPIATLSRMTRAGMLEILRQEYVAVARAKGLGEPAVIGRHALKNALIPVVTVAATRFGMQLAGAVLVEVVYAWPGVGRLVYDAIQKRSTRCPGSPPGGSGSSTAERSPRARRPTWSSSTRPGPPTGRRSSSRSPFPRGFTTSSSTGRGRPGPAITPGRGRAKSSGAPHRRP